MIVFDISEPETYDSLANWKANFTNSCPEAVSGTEIPFVIMGNKLDHERKV